MNPNVGSGGGSKWVHRVGYYYSAFMHLMFKTIRNFTNTLLWSGTHLYQIIKIHIYYP